MRAQRVVQVLALQVCCDRASSRTRSTAIDERLQEGNAHVFFVTWCAAMRHVPGSAGPLRAEGQSRVWTSTWAGSEVSPRTRSRASIPRSSRPGHLPVRPNRKRFLPERAVSPPRACREQWHGRGIEHCVRKRRGRCTREVCLRSALVLSDRDTWLHVLVLGSHRPAPFLWRLLSGAVLSSRLRPPMHATTRWPSPGIPGPWPLPLSPSALVRMSRVGGLGSTRARCAELRWRWRWVSNACNTA